MCFSLLVETLKRIVMFQHKGTNGGHELLVSGCARNPGCDQALAGKITLSNESGIFPTPCQLCPSADVRTSCARRDTAVRKRVEPQLKR